MKYTKLVFALLSSLCLCTTLHAGMQDRSYTEVLIDNLAHPHDGQIKVAVGPEGRVYLTYKAYAGNGGWVEVYSAAGELQATIEATDIPALVEGGVFTPEVVLPGAGGIFAVIHNSGYYSDVELSYEGYAFDLSVFDNDFQHYREAHAEVELSAMEGINLRGGWIQALDGGFVVFDQDYDFDYYYSGLNGRVYDSSGARLGTKSYTFSDYDSSLLIIGYSATVSAYDTDEQLTFDVDGSLLSRTEIDSPVYDQPRLENGQVVATRRAYRTKGDANAIPLPRIVSVAQVPETTLVNITYRVDDADDASVTVGILASMTDDDGQTSRLPLATLVNDTAANLGTAVPTNTELTVTWDAGVDWGAAFGDVSFDIYVNDGRPLLGFHMLTLPLPDGDLTISRSPVNDLELKEAVYYLWATNQGVRLDANQQLVGQGGVFEGVQLGSPEAPVTAASRSLVFHQLGLQEASAAQVEAARNGFDADTVYQFTPKNPISGDLLNYSQLPSSVNELGFDSVSTSSNKWWVVPAATLRVLQSSVDAPAAGGDITFTILDPSNEGWSLTTSADWLSISGATSGVGSAQITLSAAENTELSARSGTVEVNGGALSLSVTQTSDLFPDNFANRYTLSGTSGTLAVNNASATLEADEPSHFGGGGAYSLWFSFTAPADGQLSLSVDFTGDDYNQEYISIYSGTELAELSNQDHWYQNATLGMTANQTYQIAITTYTWDAPGDLDISYQFTAGAE